MVVFGVLMVLVSLLLPAISGVRHTARALTCGARIREMGQLVTLYAMEHDDRFPSALGDGDDVKQDRSKWHEYMFQIYSTFPRDPWLDWADMGPFDDILNCPDYQPLDGAEAVSDPDYILTASAFTESRYWDPALPEFAWKSWLGAKVQRHSAAVYPDRKVGVLEYRVWHGWSGTRCEGCPTEGLWHRSSEGVGSLWFLDGHVEQVHGSESTPYLSRYPIWPAMRMGTSHWGIAGRDIP